MFPCQKCHHPNKDDQNPAEAQYQLGQCYYYGRGVKKTKIWEERGITNLHFGVLKMQWILKKDWLKGAKDD